MAPRNVWQSAEDERRRVTKAHFVAMAVLVVFGAALGAYGSYLFPIGAGVTFFWPGVAVQNVGGIWCGAWGIVASAVFPIISNSIVGTPISLSLAYVPANALQSFIPAWAFRFFGVDPSLRSVRDWIVFLASVTLSNLLGATWASLVVLQHSPAWQPFLAWFVGNEIASLIFTSIFLVILSPAVVESKWFVKKWWV